MRLRWLGVCLASTVALGAQSALAQPITSCGAGQALQSFDTTGRGVTCINVPDGAALQGQVNTEVTARAAADTQLQGQINAEVTARAAADTQLQGVLNNEVNTRNNADGALLDAIGDEKNARIAADNELRASIGAETSIVGRYAYSGTQTCLNSTFGFNPNLTPQVSTDPFRAAVVSSSLAVVTGIRTFNEDGTGTMDLNAMTINYPGAFYTSTGFVGVTTGGPSGQGEAAVPGGSGSTVAQTGALFNWHIENGRLIINDVPGTGILTSGGRVNWITRLEGVPRFVGVLGKDLRVISIGHEGFSVETSILTSPQGEPFQEFRTPRICTRERTLRKM